MQWADVSLPRTKPGGRAVPPLPSAMRLLADLPRDEDNPCVVAGKVPGSYLTDLQHPWRRIRAWAELPDVRIHDLRYSCVTPVSHPTHRSITHRCNILINELLSDPSHLPIRRTVIA